MSKPSEPRWSLWCSIDESTTTLLGLLLLLLLLLLFFTATATTATTATATAVTARVLLPVVQEEARHQPAPFHVQRVLRPKAVARLPGTLLHVALYGGIGAVRDE